MECALHLPYLCDCGSSEVLVQEDILEVPKDETPTDTDELTPQEEAKFGKFLDKFLADDPPTPPQNPAVTPPVGNTAPTQANIADEINKALDAREQKKNSNDEIAKLRADVDSLKPNKPKWWQPFTPFSPR